MMEPHQGTCIHHPGPYQVVSNKLSFSLSFSHACTYSAVFTCACVERKGHTSPLARRAMVRMAISNSTVLPKRMLLIGFFSTSASLLRYGRRRRCRMCRCVRALRRTCQIRVHTCHPHAHIPDTHTHLLYTHTPDTYTHTCQTKAKNGHGPCAHG
jgi:hypothetical protein